MLRSLCNPSIRTLGFSPDGSLVTFWVRKPDGSSGGDIGIWAVPTLGGEPRPYLEGVAEFDWSQRRLPARVPHARARRPVVRHKRQPATGGSGPSLLRLRGFTVTFRFGRPTGHSFTSSRVRSRTSWISGASAPAGGTPERITSHNGRVSYPVLLDRRTLMYLASDPDGSGRGFIAWTSSAAFPTG